MTYLLIYITTTILLPLHIAIIAIRYLLGKENFDSLQNRFVITDKTRPNGQLIWIHAASVGESVAAKTLIEALQEQYPDVKFLITTGTLTSQEIINKWQLKNCIHQFLPLDHFVFTKMFLHKWQPNFAIFVESELWPTMIKTAANYCGIILVNGRISDKSYAKWQKCRIFFTEIINNFSEILAQSTIDEKKFNDLGARNVTNIGNLKFSNKQLPVNEEVLKELSKAIGKQRVFVAASTHSEDEEIIIPTIKKLLKNGEAFFSIIILRHPHRLSEITELCNYYQLQYSARSTTSKPQKDDQVYIVDTFGELGTFFSLSNIVFVGGSYKQGGHNLLEPAFFNCSIIVGPNMTNYQNITDEMLSANALLQISTQEELADKIKFLISKQGIDESKELAKNAYEFVQKRQQVIYKYLDKIKSYLS